MGYFAMAMNLAVVAGPFIGLSLLQFISFTAFFVVLSILMVISVVFSFFVQITEEKQTDQTRPSLAIKWRDRKSTRLNSSHVSISYAVFCLKKKNTHSM